jgi:hypothetical protein
MINTTPHLTFMITCIHTLSQLEGSYNFFDYPNQMTYPNGWLTEITLGQLVGLVDRVG